MKNLQIIEKEIKSAKSLQSIVNTMKAFASSNISQFQKAASASWRYKENLDKALYVVLLEAEKVIEQEEGTGSVLHIIFGSDHGLAGRFNERIVAYSLSQIKNQKNNMQVIIGHQVLARLPDNIDNCGFFNVPHTTENITNQVNLLLLKIDELRSENKIEKIILHYNKPIDKITFMEESETLFPVDLKTYTEMTKTWDSKRIPTYFSSQEEILRSLIQQYLFITLYRAFCFSLASENASRLASMQSASDNIEEKLAELTLEYRSVRQDSITEELNDIISGFKVISKFDE